MTYYLIDTNIFLEWLLGRLHAKDCESLFVALQERKLMAICTNFSVYSVCIYLTNSGKGSETEKYLDFISSTENLQTINIQVDDCKKIVQLMRKVGLDFDDTVQYSAAIERDCNGIITLDQDFKKTGIHIFTPKEVLETIPPPEQEQ